MSEHRKKQVTLPGLSFKKREIAYIKVLAPMTKSVRDSEQSKDDKPATVMKVLNLQDHKEYRLICPSLMVSSFADEGEEYVGKCYEVIVPAELVPGKRYKNCEVYEIDPSIDYTHYPMVLSDDVAPSKPETASA